jgi:hypothetical protein
MHPPYIGSGEELFNDLVLAYKAGAKYFLIFSYPNITRYGTLTEEHFEALEKFWSYVKHNSREYGVYRGDVGYILPKDFGFGFRNVNNTIWGLWDGGELSKKIWRDVVTLFEKYGHHLDIVYEDEIFDQVIKMRYRIRIFWNETFLSES